MDFDEVMLDEGCSDLIFSAEQLMEWVRWLRDHRGVTYRELEKATGVTDSEIHHALAARQEIRLSSFVKVCAELGVPPGWVIDVSIQSNAGLFYQRIRAETAFADLLKEANIDGPPVDESAGRFLASGAVLAAILLRVSKPVARVQVVGYPSEDIRQRFHSFAARLQDAGSSIDRHAALKALQRTPVQEMDRFDLVSRSTLVELRDNWKQSPEVRRQRTFAWIPQVLNYADAGAYWDLTDEKGENRVLTQFNVSVNLSPMKTEMPGLLGRLRKATEARGRKSELAAWLGVPLPTLSVWLSGKQEPGGEATLRLLQWVRAEEAKPKGAGSAVTPPAPKTQHGKQLNELKKKSGPRKR